MDQDNKPAKTHDSSLDGRFHAEHPAEAKNRDRALAKNEAASQARKGQGQPAKDETKAERAKDAVIESKNEIIESKNDELRKR